MRESLRFHLQRDEDETGISGTGVVAYGVKFPDGTCVLRWDTAVNSTTFYASINDVDYLHGHGGRTRIVWDDVPSKRYTVETTADSDARDAALGRAFVNDGIVQDPYPEAPQCQWTDEQDRRCQWNTHPGNVHNILGIPGTPTVPTAIR